MTIREYSIDYNNPEAAARTTINIHRDTLIYFRGTTPHQEELEWEIRLYEFMLEDPVARLKAYQDTRYDKNDMQRMSKRAVVARLGWNVPAEDKS